MRFAVGLVLLTVAAGIGWWFFEFRQRDRVFRRHAFSIEENQVFKRFALGKDFSHSLKSRVVLNEENLGARIADDVADGSFRHRPATPDTVRRTPTPTR